MWSVGCLLFELLTGSFLFHDDDWARFYLCVTGDETFGSGGGGVNSGSSGEGGNDAVAAPPSVPLLPLLSEDKLSLLEEVAGEVQGAPAALETLLRLILVREAADRRTTEDVMHLAAQARP